MPLGMSTAVIAGAAPSSAFSLCRGRDWGGVGETRGESSGIKLENKVEEVTLRSTLSLRRVGGRMERRAEQES